MSSLQQNYISLLLSFFIPHAISALDAHYDSVETHLIRFQQDVDFVPKRMSDVAVCFRGMPGSADAIRSWKKFVFPAIGEEPDVFVSTAASKDMLANMLGFEMPENDDGQSHFARPGIIEDEYKIYKNRDARNPQHNPMVTLTATNAGTESPEEHSAFSTTDGKGKKFESENGDKVKVLRWHHAPKVDFEAFMDDQAAGWRGISPQAYWLENSIFSGLPFPVDYASMTATEREFMVKKLEVYRNYGFYWQREISPRTGRFYNRPYRVGASIPQHYDLFHCKRMLQEEEAKRGKKYDHIMLSRLDMQFFAPHPDILGYIAFPPSRHPKTGALIQDIEDDSDFTKADRRNEITRTLTFNNLGYDKEQNRNKQVRVYDYGCYVPSGNDFIQGLNDQIALCNRRAADLYMVKRLETMGIPYITRCQANRCQNNLYYGFY